MLYRSRFTLTWCCSYMAKYINVSSSMSTRVPYLVSHNHQRLTIHNTQIMLIRDPVVSCQVSVLLHLLNDDFCFSWLVIVWTYLTTETFGPIPHCTRFSAGFSSATSVQHCLFPVWLYFPIVQSASVVM